MKNDRVVRNYAYDMPGTYKEVYIALCDGFDEMQKDCIEGVKKSDMIGYIMKATKGRVNPMVLNEILKEFER